MRLGISDRVYRATAACIDAAPGDDNAYYTFAAIAEYLVSGTPLFWHQQGDTIRVGQAWVSQDEQWWLSKAARMHEALMVQRHDRREFEMTWSGMGGAGSSRCAHLIDGTTDHDDDGKIVRVLDFTLERQTLHAVSPQGASPSAACAAFECVDGATLPASCIAECQRWRVPIVVELTQVEAFDRFGLCN
ncbi:MAG: hypothetical protein H6705_16495 [Myxococcales bacterium]|nr:hypothetical protein [Myxococcales bacterium]